MYQPGTAGHSLCAYNYCLVPRPSPRIAKQFCQLDIKKKNVKMFYSSWKTNPTQKHKQPNVTSLFIRSNYTFDDTDYLSRLQATEMNAFNGSLVSLMRHNISHRGSLIDMRSVLRALPALGQNRTRGGNRGQIP